MKKSDSKNNSYSTVTTEHIQKHDQQSGNENKVTRSYSQVVQNTNTTDTNALNSKIESLLHNEAQIFDKLFNQLGSMIELLTKLVTKMLYFVNNDG